ncbi:integrase [Candidatus Clostridium stratigraminis]
MNEQASEIESYDEQLVRRLIEKVTVHNERYAVEFKSGMSMEVER